MKFNNKRTVILVESAVMVSMASILSLIRIISLPYGGSVTLCCMLPLVILSYRRGIRWGIGASLVFSVIQMILGMGTISAAFLPGEDQMVLYKAILMVVLDYFIAYSFVGFSGIVHKGSPSKCLCIGSIIGCTARYIAHFLSGFILWGSYAEWFFEDQMSNNVSKWILQHFSGNGLAAIYSLIYNGSYMIPEIIITSFAAYIIGKIPQISNK